MRASAALAGEKLEKAGCTDEASERSGVVVDDISEVGKKNLEVCGSKGGACDFTGVVRDFTGVVCGFTCVVCGLANVVGDSACIAQGSTGDLHDFNSIVSEADDVVRGWTGQSGDTNDVMRESTGAVRGRGHAMCESASTSGVATGDASESISNPFDFLNVSCGGAGMAAVQRDEVREGSGAVIGGSDIMLGVHDVVGECPSSSTIRIGASPPREGSR